MQVWIVIGFVIALSFLGHTRNDTKDDAYYCYAAARLSGFIWTDYQTMGASDASRLYRVELGDPASETRSVSGIDYRSYTRGVVALNDRPTLKKVRLVLADSLPHAQYEDVYTGRTLVPQDGRLQVEIPPHSGRVYVRV